MMQILLENYLNDVASHLKPMPFARRNEELREMRQHLQNAVIVKQEFGQSEDQAVKSAIEQFGLPEELGENIVSVWRREKQKQYRWSLWKATGIWTAFCLFEGVEYPHDVYRLALIPIPLLVLLGIQYLPEKYIPKRLVFKPGPLGPTKAWFVTICAVAMFVLNFINVPHSLKTHIFPPIDDMLVIFAVWYGRSRLRRQTE